MTTGWWFRIFHPEPWGFMIQFDEHIFQMGWFNHQLDKVSNLSGFFRIPPKTHGHPNRRKIGSVGNWLVEVIGVVLPKCVSWLRLRKRWGKTGESNPITDPWDERYIYLHFFVDFYGKWYIYLHFFVDFYGKWYIYLHFFVDLYGKCREIYQSHGWYGNGTDAIKNPLGERTVAGKKIHQHLPPKKPEKIQFLGQLKWY